LGGQQLLTADNVADIATSTVYAYIDNGGVLNQQFCDALTDANQKIVCNTILGSAELTRDAYDALLGALVQAVQCLGVSTYNTLSILGGTTQRGLLMGRSNLYNNLTRDVEMYEILPKPKNRRSLLQTSNCAGTASCFQQCPSCQRFALLCTDSARNTASDRVCPTLGLVATTASIPLFAAFCAPACLLTTLAAPVCEVACVGLLSGALGIGVNADCHQIDINICNTNEAACAACRAGNSNCDPSTTQCCAGETGTACGNGCCCCPRCQAPTGVNCACAAAAC
jgi:hypothetical protein